jgi:hypothetical protein
MDKIVLIFIFSGIAVAMMVSENARAEADCKKDHSAYYCENGGAIDYVATTDD